MSKVYVRPTLYFGDNALQVLSILQQQKIMIVCDTFLIETGVLELITSCLDRSNQWKLFDGVISDPTLTAITDGVRRAVAFQPDVVIGFGGGSAIDMAKGVIYFAVRGGLIARPRFIAIPTTSGTGSEMTSVAVLTDPADNRKHVIQDDMLYADDAILETKLVLSVPPVVTAATGLDVLTHAVEAYVATGANHYTDALAEKAVELVLQSLLTCFRDGKNKAARADLHEAASLAGIAFNLAGLGAVHSLAHQVGGQYHIPHGRACALLLTAVIEFNCQDDKTKDKYAALAYRLGLVNRDESAAIAIKTMIQTIDTLINCLNLPRTIESLVKINKIEYEQSVPEMADRALVDRCMSSTPIKMTKIDLINVLHSLF